ncbi:MAG TPA: hypothetical protein VE198_09385 [Actinoallomurus sp.]|nr:hypothetical protein [Actinoallomurus sp.]
MRITFLTLMLVLAACSPGRHSDGHSGGQVRTPSPTPTVAPTFARTPATAPPPGEEKAPPGQNTGAHTVTFAIKGSVRRTSVTYTMPGGPKRHSVVSPPWSKTFTVKDGQSIDVSAHSTGAGELTCTLKVDGELVKSATSSGGSATVDCGDSFGF